MEKSDKIVSKYLEAVDRYDRAQKTLNEGIQNVSESKLSGAGGEIIN